MRHQTRVLAVLALVLGTTGFATAQNASPTELKIQIVFSAFDGDKKIASLPYTITAVGEERDASQYQASLRLGISVPILLQTKEGSPQTQYQDVGTNIDARAKRFEDGRYKLTFSIERSSIFAADGSEENTIRPSALREYSPLLRRYRGSFDLLLRDGQTAQGPVATDPQSGRILKTEVTLNVAR